MLGIYLFIYLLSISDGKATECPKECPDEYNPICVRGISYSNKCVLLQTICKNKLDEQILSEIEKCPSYDRQAEARDKSVEAIDKNGVIFRSFFKDQSNSEEAEE
ncbi:uncharacterized protein LOC103580808 [Microplitis demolitor]|uniref:uncharacterized protein LOC103580808 n=1 Tax=Microplitis demolitor TaxID=69319 RepID=UPI0004CDB414|nr:uncharacterized protein LOC103580808 [Microplitis demolitor]